MAMNPRLYAIMKARFPTLYKRHPELFRAFRGERKTVTQIRGPPKPIPRSAEVQKLVEGTMIGKATRKIITPAMEPKVIKTPAMRPLTQQEILQQKLGGTMIGSAAQKVQAAKLAHGTVIDPETTWPMRQFEIGHPDIQIPRSKYGDYDIVRVTRVQGPTPSSYREQYVFDYSNVSKHKIKIAGSTENYNKYLRIVREHPEVAGLHLFAGPLNIDLAMASNVIGPSGASEREDILIEQLHRWKGSPKGKGDLARMGSAIIENPFVQISLAEAGGMAAGKLLTGAGSYLTARFGPRAAQIFNIAQAGAGTAIAAPTVYDIGQEYYEGEYEEAVPKTVMAGLLLGAGWEGYREGRAAPKLWGRYKGLTPAEAGFQKGLVKSKLYDPLQKEYLNTIAKIKQDLRLRHPQIIQKDPTFADVQALKQYDQRQVTLLRNAIKNQLIMLKNKAQASGGAATEKVNTHDIDNLFRRARDPVVLNYIARKLGIDPNMVFDPHQLPRTGSIITQYGTPKEPPYIYKSGARGIRYTEQWFRKAESAAALAHEGRVKDIKDAQTLLNLIYQRTGGVPSHMKDVVSRYQVLSAELAASPRMMDPKASQLLYHSGLGKKFWDLRTKFYQKTLTKSYLNTQFDKLTALEKAAFTDMISSAAGGYLPPSITMKSPSMAVSDWSSVFNQLSGMYPGLDPSYVAALSQAYTVSQPGYKPKKSIKKISPGPDLRSIFVSDFLSMFPGSQSYVPPSEQIRPPYPYKRSKPYISPQPPYYIDLSEYYSPPPPSSSIWSKDYSSPPPPPSSYYTESYSPPPPLPPPPPAFLFWPWFGGKVASRGRADPYAVKYINEWELMQDLMRKVIF